MERGAEKADVYCHRYFSDEDDEHEGCECCGGLMHYVCIIGDDYLSEDEKEHIFCLSCR